MQLNSSQMILLASLKIKPKLHEKSTQCGQNSTKLNKHRLKCDMYGKTLKTKKSHKETDGEWRKSQ